jgi:hypothetical protein
MPHPAACNNCIETKTTQTINAMKQTKQNHIVRYILLLEKTDRRQFYHLRRHVHEECQKFVSVSSTKHQMILNEVRDTTDKARHTHAMIHTHTHTHTHTRTYIHTHTHTHTYIYIYIYTSTHLHGHIPGVRRVCLDLPCVCSNSDTPW